MNNVYFIFMKFFSRSILPVAVFLLFTQFIFADPPDWEDDPGAYEFTATISGAIILDESGEQMGDDGDIFAAFDEGENVRGAGVMLDPPFGPYMGTPVFEMTMRSDAAGDLLTFKYYDASDDAILDISETYTFVINEIIAGVLDPIVFNIGSVDEECADDDAAVAPFDCAAAVASFGCDTSWGGSTIGELCPVSCDTCPEEPEDVPETQFFGEFCPTIGNKFSYFDKRFEKIR